MTKMPTAADLRAHLDTLDATGAALIAATQDARARLDAARAQYGEGASLNDLRELEAVHRSALADEQAHAAAVARLSAQFEDQVKAERVADLESRLSEACTRLNELESRAARRLSAAEYEAIRAGHAYREAATVAVRLRSVARGHALALARLQGRLAPHEELARNPSARLDAEEGVLRPWRLNDEDKLLTLGAILGGSTNPAEDLSAHSRRWRHTVAQLTALRE